MQFRFYSFPWVCGSSPQWRYNYTWTLCHGGLDPPSNK